MRGSLNEQADKMANPNANNTHTIIFLFMDSAPYHLKGIAKG